MGVIFSTDHTPLAHDNVIFVSYNYIVTTPMVTTTRSKSDPRGKVKSHLIFHLHNSCMAFQDNHKCIKILHFGGSTPPMTCARPHRCRDSAPILLRDNPQDCNWQHALPPFQKTDAPYRDAPPSSELSQRHARSQT